VRREEGEEGDSKRGKVKEGTKERKDTIAAQPVWVYEVILANNCIPTVMTVGGQQNTSVAG
jgi:hypothetical protein